jgi:hypothetical protein
MVLTDYNRQFVEKIQRKEPIYNNTERYGIAIKQLKDITVPLNAKQYWRLIGLHHLTGQENKGNHHIYCDVLDGTGRRINQARMQLQQASSAPEYAVVDKPANEAGTNFVMWSNTRATVSVSFPADSPLPSEAVSGLRSDLPDEEIGTTWGHHSWYLVFQLTNIPQPGSKPKTIDAGEQPGTGDPALTLEETVAAAGQPNIIPLNPNAMFYKIAQLRQLGERLTSEYDVEYDDRKFRAQIYERGIVYAEVGDWGNVKIIPRTN